MTVFAWILAGLWGLILLATARVPLRRLPPPAPDAPPYALWLPAGGEPPPLEPPPVAVHVGPEPPPEAAEWILVLGNGVGVTPDLPGRLVACGADFVSVLPRPVGPLPRLAVERFRRDFAGAERVIDPRNPAAWADARCAWLRAADLDLPGDGGEPVLRVARARKAHGLPLDLREGAGLPVAEAPRAQVTAPALTWADHRAAVDDLTDGDPVIRAILVAAPLLLCLGPLAGLAFEATRLPSALALGLGSAARLMLAVRDDFGPGLALAGWFFEPALAATLARAPRRRAPAPFPDSPTAEPPALTAPRVAPGRAWLEAAAVPFLARRLGGGAAVMEQIYANRPAGRTALGRLVDRAVHRSPAARAVRFRRIATVEVARALRPRTVLSVPCGGAGDAAAIGAPRTVLVDPDPAARALAAAACPGAEIHGGTVDDAPPGPFDVVLYIGLSEYLADGDVLAHLRALRARLAEGGALLVSATAEHPQRRPMQAWLGWHTRARSPEAVATLLHRAGFAVERRLSDPFGIQWLFVARDAASRADAA